MYPHRDRNAARPNALVILLALLSPLLAGCGGSSALQADSASTPATSALESITAPSGYLRGVNLVGAEFTRAGDSPPASSGALPGIYDQDYVYPNAAELDYYKQKGLTLIRLPFRWERLQHPLNSPLDSTELGRLDALVAAARQRNMHIIIDPHNYGRYYDRLIGTKEVPNSAFADFWRRLARHYQGETAVWAYGLMNEPHDSQGLWPGTAQAAVDAIRTVDQTHRILVPGDNWSNGWTWGQFNDTLQIQDPANNFMYEAHQYFDQDYSGEYKMGYVASGAYPDIGVDRIKPFVSWLKARHAHGLVGEYGIPANDLRWQTVLDRFLTYLDANDIGGCYWDAGPWLEDDNLSIEPVNGKDRSQMSVLVRHLGTSR